MNNCSKSFAFAVLTCGVAFAAVLTFESQKMTENLKADMQDVMKLVMKPHMLSRYIPSEAYKMLGLDASTRLMKYRWNNCGNNKTENLIIHNIIFSPDPLTFPGKLTVSFNLSVGVNVQSGLRGEVLMEKKIGSSWVKLPCLGIIGSCTYDDICTYLNPITQCPATFEKRNIPCKCPFHKGTYVLPSATFEIDADFLPPGDFHFRANLTVGKLDGGCYDLYASFT